MKSRASLLLLAALLPLPAAAQVAGDPPGGEGPRASSGEGAARFDAVGQAVVDPALGAGVVAGHATLAEGSVAEVTALDTGRTIVAQVARRGAAEAGVLAALSPAAARQLGIAGPRAAVRIRPAAASPQEQASLAAGRTAEARLDAPPMLLTALRRRMGEASGSMQPIAAATAQGAPSPAERATASPRNAAPRTSDRGRPASAANRFVAKPFVPDPRPSAKPAPSPKPATPARATPPITGGFVVQVASLSDAARARTLARVLNGTVSPAGRLYRVRTGPYATRAAAERARADAARRGYPDAQILRQD